MRLLMMNIKMLFVNSKQTIGARWSTKSKMKLDPNANSNADPIIDTSLLEAQSKIRLTSLKRSELSFNEAIAGYEKEKKWFESSESYRRAKSYFQCHKE